MHSYVRRVAKVCKNFGQRVQYSVFECIVAPCPMGNFQKQVLNESSWHLRMKQEDHRALSTLIYSHINPYGIFELDMNERLAIHAAA
ncbi:CRISPR-associated endonuclease Cas2 [Desulfogranum japonicum]|uniref:CRISPR-associated endonuclease Cas2 n=1 Tax=Desulfogranum japonicum TaxID=231447 RepID=UPI0004052E11|nr:CRISPR-associated endonuclease Cas2 [Desulfogranum japonicum]